MTTSLAALAALLFAHADAGADADASLVVRHWERMHTRITVAVVGASEAEAAPVLDEADAIFARVEEVMNEWEPESALARINRGAGGAAVPAPADLCEVIGLALDGAKRTGGLFDPTWAALRGVWRFGDDAVPTLPTEKQLASACARIDYRAVEVRPVDKPTAERACTVRLARRGMQLGLGGIAKGWAVDKVVALLRQRGLSDFYVQAGGDLFLGGTRGGRPWRAAIRDPRGPPTAIFAKLEVTDRAFSTSGDYERFFILDGKRYHHLIDPRTCRPATRSASATILARSAVEAEILTKATFILGPGEGEALAAKHGASVVLVAPNGGVHLSPELQGKLSWAPPAGFGGQRE